MAKIEPIKVAGKPTYLKMAHTIDFFELFKILDHAFTTTFFLESLGEQSYISRHSIIGFDPAYTVSGYHDGRLLVDSARKGLKEYIVENPYYALRELIPQNIIARKYAGGLVGFLGYDCVNFFEPSLKVQSSRYFEPFKFGLYKDGIILDKMTGEVFYFYYDENRLPTIEALIRSGQKNTEKLYVKYLGDSKSKLDHRTDVETVKKKICQGRVFQCEVGFKSNYEVTGNSLRLYESLRSYNPSPHMYYFKFDDQKIVGASPELLFKLSQGEMESFPLAGTIRRGKNAAEDQMLARQLLNDPKEIAEHNMLIDLHRNDIGRVARFGTVKVRKLMDIKRFSHVQHIASEIVGIIDDREDMFSSLASNFPAGTLSGAPKIEAMKIIDKIEKSGRGPYGGAIGTFSFNGDCVFAIPIRTLFQKGKEAYVQTCGGNVYDSVADHEYEEIKRKLAAMKNLLDGFEQ